MKIYLLFLLVFLFISYTADAQDSLKISTLSLSIGPNYILNKDQFQSDYTYRGINFFVNSVFIREKPKGIHILDAIYSSGKIKTVLSPKASNNIYFLNYNYLFRFRNIGKKISAFAGGGAGSMLSINNYLPHIEEPKTYYSGTIFLSASGRIGYSVNNKSKINLDLNLPIFSGIYRPDFDVYGKTYTGTSFVFQHLSVFAKLEYEYKLSNKYKFILDYRYSYFSYGKPRSIDIMQNGLTLGIKKLF